MQKSPPRQPHFERLWASYLAHPTARQADKWIAGYFREHKAYGKKDRAWYAEAFFALLRQAVRLLPLEKSPDAVAAWQALQETPELAGRFFEKASNYAPYLSPATNYAPGGPKATNYSLDITPETIHEAGLPQSWLAWLARSSLAPLEIPAFLRNLATKPPLYLRVNYPTEAKAIEADLRAAGFGVTITESESGLVSLRAVGQTPIYELDSLKKGLVEIQDLASQRLGEAVDAHPGMSVWDVCAGGGGKTMQIASQMLAHSRAGEKPQGRGVLYASDIREYKLDEVKLRARRAGFHHIRRFVYDAERDIEPTREIKNSGGFHRVLVDAPCSASGTLRRNPDVRFRIAPGDLERFAVLQLKILTAVHPHVKRGGKLIYATCSVFRDENEDVVKRFLENVVGFTLLQSSIVGSPALDSDTMYFAVMRRDDTPAFVRRDSNASKECYKPQ